MSDILESNIKFLQGVGPKRADLLSKELNINTFRDLIHFFPFRYVDRSKIYSISEIESTMSYIQIRGSIAKMTEVGEGSRKKRLIITIKDASGTIDLVFFKGIKWIKEKLSYGSEYIIFGKPTIFNQTINFVHPEIEESNNQSASSQENMIGVYPSTEKLRNSGISNKIITQIVYNLINKLYNNLGETLPSYIVSKNRLLSYRDSIKNIHFPKDLNTLSQAQFRLKYEELLLLQLSILKQKRDREIIYNGILFPRISTHFYSCFNEIPFELTDAQKRVIKEIRADMTSGKQMNRLLQGDVGSGKTMVAILSCLIAVDNEYQACIMAPTEVLAKQHYNNSTKLLKGSVTRVALLTGSTKKRDKIDILEKLLTGDIDILIGTHALIEDNVQFKNLGIAVIDEQHRFGVDQRSRLWDKNTTPPHILVMTATPIPRTLAMTLYGDLDVSIIDQLPPGRKPIKTIHAKEHQRNRINTFLKEQINRGRQVFIVFPLIKESEKMDYKNLQEGYMNIIEEFPAPKYITAVVHGQQKQENKEHDMNLFVTGKANILVSTTVIEVGVDVPNASVMVIESAERFGLSQLHQLRGRVGRGAEESFCILMTSHKLSKESHQRIDLMCSTNDGFELAEADLKMRGPGDIDGTQQSGLPIDLKLSSLSKDGPILEECRATAKDILIEDPLLNDPKNRIFKIRLDKRIQEIDYSIIS